MQAIDIYRWRVTDPVSGRRYVTRYPMSEFNAKDLDPNAELIEGTHETLLVQQVVLPASARRFQATKQ
jgi:hypothetical protein